MFNKVIRFILGHKRIKEFENEATAPFGVGVGDLEYYQLWPCDRCECLYFERKKYTTGKSMGL